MGFDAYTRGPGVEWWVGLGIRLKYRSLVYFETWVAKADSGYGEDPSEHCALLTCQSSTWVELLQNSILNMYTVMWLISAVAQEVERVVHWSEIGGLILVSSSPHAECPWVRHWNLQVHYMNGV